MVKRGSKKNNSNLIKWIIAILLFLAILLISYKFFTGQAIAPTGGFWLSSIKVHPTGTSTSGDIFNISCAGISYYKGYNSTLQFTYAANNSFVGTYADSAKFIDLAGGIPLPDVSWISDGIGIINFSQFYPAAAAGSANSIINVRMVGDFAIPTSQIAVTLSSNSCSFTCVSGTCKSCNSCSQLGKICGSVISGCGLALNCGNCSTGKTCVNGQCVCIPKTCSQLGKTCGNVSDGCGKTLSCGNCTLGRKCVNGQCSCSPKGAKVGSMSQCCNRGGRHYLWWIICN